MRSIVKTALVSAAAAGMIATGGVTGSASAQNISANNLVNVQIDNVLNNNNVEVDVVVPITAAANICGVDVTALASRVADGPTQCTSRAGQTVDVMSVLSR